MGERNGPRIGPLSRGLALSPIRHVTVLPPASVDAVVNEPVIHEETADVAHQLKTPLASLIGYSKILRGNWGRISEERRDEYFGVIERQGHRMLLMIEGLLEASRAGLAPEALRRRPLDLQGLINATVETAYGVSASHNIVLQMPRGDLGLYGDANAIEHVLSNLLDNAVKYSPERSTITIVVLEQGQTVHVSVSDQGSGIDPDDAPHIFERFRRGPNESASGAGLGLCIVRSLVFAHGGQVWADTNPSGGAIFTFTLPRRTP